MYGLKQAARSWNLKADQVLKSLHFSNFYNEPCVYIRHFENSVIIIALYVDDFYVLYNDEKGKTEVFNCLKERFQIKDLGQAVDCLGMKLIRDWSNGTLILQQEEYVKTILNRFKMNGCTGHSTPVEVGAVLPPKASKETKIAVNVASSSDKSQRDPPYQEVIGCLLYLSTNTRPDISYIVSFLSQFNANHKAEHWNMLKRVLSYLKKTPKVGLKFVKQERPTFCLTGFADADLAGNPADYYSYSGFCFLLDGNLISWESRKQRISAQHSTEAEYLSLSEATKEALHLSEFINKLTKCGEQRVTIFNDNKSAIALAYSENFSARTRHLGVRIQLVRENVQRGNILLEHMSTDIMPADVLTKPLNRINHEKCMRNLSLFMG